MKKISYKLAIEELESIKIKIQSGEIDLDELSSAVKRAKELIKYCQNKLRATEKVLNELIDEDSEQ